MPVQVYIFITNNSQFFATKPAYYITSKGKPVRKQAWTGPEGSKNLRLMMAVRFLAPAVFTPQEIFLVFISV